jgi:homoserine dehydrogenase
LDKIYVGLLGLGNVGTGFYNTLEMNRSKISSYLNKEIIVKKVLVNDINKKRDLDFEGLVLTDNFDEIIEDSEIEIIVEVLGGLEPSFSYIKKSLIKGKKVVTANKAVVATYSKELSEICSKYKGTLRYEGSVGGGIPIINTLTTNLVSNEIKKMIGIINGTTNFILTQMTDNQMEFDQALKLAQERGYAEADPTSDLEGEDAAFKLSILSDVAFNKKISPDKIPTEGIKKISQKDIQYASELGYIIKLLAIGINNEDQLELTVHPALIKKDHPLASVKNEFNALFVEGNSVGEVMMYGKGAGSMPTGSAVLGDVINIIKFDLDANCLTDKNHGHNLDTIGENQFYVRLEVYDKPGVLGKVALCFGKYNVSIESVVQRARGDETAPLIFITHDARRKDIDKALEEIKSYKSIKSVESILRVEN